MPKCSTFIQRYSLFFIIFASTERQFAMLPLGYVVFVNTKHIVCIRKKKRWRPLGDCSMCWTI